MAMSAQEIEDLLRETFPEAKIAITDLAKRVIHLTESTSSIEFIPYDIAYEEGFEDMERRVPDTTRARELVGFAPTAGLDDIIRSVIEDQQR